MRLQCSSRSFTAASPPWSQRYSQRTPTTIPTTPASSCMHVLATFPTKIPNSKGG